jgi:hypothetical protein
LIYRFVVTCRFDSLILGLFCGILVSGLLTTFEGYRWRLGVRSPGRSAADGVERGRADSRGNQGR